MNLGLQVSGLYNLNVTIIISNSYFHLDVGNDFVLYHSGYDIF